MSSARTAGLQRRQWIVTGRGRHHVLGVALVSVATYACGTRWKEMVVIETMMTHALRFGAYTLWKRSITGMKNPCHITML